MGADWLESLDEVMVSWKRSTLKIDMGGEWFCLQGDPNLQKSEMSCRALKRVMHGKEEAYLVEFAELRMTEVAYEELEKDVQELLEKYPEVQVSSTVLPPPRAVDHVIDLKPGAIPPNIRPYRYPY